jgi:hypothetical protein
VNTTLRTGLHLIFNQMKASSQGGIHVLKLNAAKYVNLLKRFENIETMDYCKA